MKRLFLIAPFLAIGLAFAQQKPTRPSFEVAAIRPLDPNSSPLVAMSADPTIVRYGNITLRDAIRGAYRIRAFQIVTPDWMGEVRFQIEGKLPEGAKPDEAPEMLQSLLEDRFKMQIRRETKEMNIYALLVGRDGPKLKATQTQVDEKTPLAMGTDGKPRQLVGWSGTSTDLTVFAPGASLLTFVGVTSRFTELPLVDLTGIDGLYDFQIRFVPEVTDGLAPVAPNGQLPPDPAPTLSDALKQYGLRIEKRKMPVEMLIVTHAERMPTEN